jgi:glycosyltransferase involved in cell wall biosynthesis
MLPPVDVHHNSSDAVNSLPFRERYGIESGDITLVTVSRLSDWMKAESLIRTIDVIGTLGRDFPLRLLIVGDGSARAKLQLLADKTNADLKRSAVVLTGAMLDPRPAYAASDIVIGMGGSALRGMAFGKPVVIVGDQGFALPLTPDTAYSFYYHGIYGRGDGCSSNEHFVSIIRELADNPGQILSLGKFSREFILSHYSLETASARLAELCHRAAREALPLHITAIDGLRTTAIYLRERRFLTPSRDNAPIDMISSLHLPNKVRSSVDPCDTELS